MLRGAEVMILNSTVEFTRVANEPVTRWGAGPQARRTLHRQFLAAPRIGAVIAAVDPAVRKRITKCLAQVGIRYQIVEPADIGAHRGYEQILWLCSRSVCEMQHVPGPTVVVCCGCSVPDGILPLLAESSAVLMKLDDLTPTTALEAIVSATKGVSQASLTEHLASSPVCSGIPPPLVEAFVAAPGNRVLLMDVCFALGVSKEGARAIVRAAGFELVAHLYTAMRAESWIWFASHGFVRREFERYLGITDRPTFRRGCSRAAVPVPWSDPLAGTRLDPHGFEPLSATVDGVPMQTRSRMSDIRP